MNWIFCWLAMVASVSVNAQAVCSRSAVTVLRKGPGLNFDKTWIVTKYMPFLKLDLKPDSKSDIKKGWIKLQDLEGQTHYGRTADFTQAIRCVVIKTNTSETRTGPGIDFPFGDFKTLDRYTPLKRLTAERGWVQVENDLGWKSWVPESKVWHPVKVMGVKF